MHCNNRNAYIRRHNLANTIFMNCTLVTKDVSATQVFKLLDEAGVKEVLRYNPLQRSTRIFYAGNQRLFFIERGHSRNSFVFKNEYGFTMGSLHMENINTEEGTVVIENRKFYYQQDGSSTTTQLLIYEENEIRPMASCGFLHGRANQKTPLYRNKEITHEFAGLLLGLCCWLSNTILTELSTDYQAALSMVQ